MPHIEIHLKGGTVLTFEANKVTARSSSEGQLTKLEYQQSPTAVRRPTFIDPSEVAAAVFIDDEPTPTGELEWPLIEESLESIEEKIRAALKSRKPVSRSQ